MAERVVLRYSECFKRQVVQELESGRFSCAEQARLFYGIGGRTTIPGWVRRYGKSHLMPKVVRVERPNEADVIRQLRQENEQLKKALGQTQAQSLLNAGYLTLACEQLGQDVEAFKKKLDGKRSTTPSPTAR